jgi:hypothetical protein
MHLRTSDMAVMSLGQHLRTVPGCRSSEKFIRLLAFVVIKYNLK